MMRSMLVVLGLLVALPAAAETITVGKSCSDDPPETRFDRPLCADEQWHDVLIESVEDGDRSGLALLQRRYEAADTDQEKHRLGAVLLAHLPNPDAVWKELSERIAVAFKSRRDEQGELPPEYERYCEERGVDPLDLRTSSLDALQAVSGHPRSRALLHQALQTYDVDLVMIALVGLGEQRDSSALPAIAAALERFSHFAGELAFLLALFDTPEADALAYKYIADADRADYRRGRQSPVEQ